MSRLALRALFLAALALAALGADAATLSASPTSVYSGQSDTATWSGIAAPTSTDWIALYIVGRDDNNYVSWRYTDGTAAGSAAFSIAADAAPGTYEFRLFSNNGYTRLATSNSFTVQTPPPATLSVSPTSIYPSQSVTASWSAIFAPTATDWIGLYHPGSADNNYVSTRYTDGNAAGSVPFTIPGSATAGTYELRLFSHDGYTRLATSNSFSVQNPPVTLSVSPTNVAPGATATAAWTNVYPSSATDWIGLYLPNAADTASITWRYTTGTAAGNVPFGIPATVTPGEYQLRLFSTNSYTRLASVNFSVGSAKLAFIHVDHLNTPRLIANETGQTVWRWDQQEPFGVTVPNENPSGFGTFEFALRFPGQYFDKETKLADNQTRDYDTFIGRYVESDRIGLRGGLNTYSYVRGDPVRYVDPRGEFAFILPLAILGAEVAVDAAIAVGGLIGGAMIADVLSRSRIPDSAADDREVPAGASSGSRSGRDHCLRLFLRCDKERWGGDWTCAQCHFFCTGVNEYWPFEHCSPDECRF